MSWTTRRSPRSPVPRRPSRTSTSPRTGFFRSAGPAGRAERGIPALAPGAPQPRGGASTGGAACDLVWATTWEDEANAEVAPRIGLPRLPVVTWPESSAAHEHEDQWFRLHWKTRTLVEWAGRRRDHRRRPRVGVRIPSRPSSPSSRRVFPRTRRRGLHRPRYVATSKVSRP